MMEASQLKTVTVPGVGPNSQAILVANATDRPMRVLVDNVGANPMRIAFSSSSLANATSDGADHYQLSPAQFRYFVLAPKQRLFAIAIGATGRLSIHTSEALPFDAKMGG